MAVPTVIVRHKSVRITSSTGVLWLSQGVLFGRAEVRCGNLRLDEAEDLRGSGDLLRLDGLMNQFGGNARLQFRQARILRGDLEHLLDELERFIEAAGLRERFHRPFEHGEAMHRSRIERHGDPAKFLQGL